MWWKRVLWFLYVYSECQLPPNTHTPLGILPLWGAIVSCSCIKYSTVYTYCRYNNYSKYTYYNIYTINSTVVYYTVVSLIGYCSIIYNSCIKYSYIYYNIIYTVAVINEVSTT